MCKPYRFVLKHAHSLKKTTNRERVSGGPVFFSTFAPKELNILLRDIMVIEQQITKAIIAGIKELYGADVTANQVQLQKTKKEFKGHLTLVVFPFLRQSKKSPEQTAQELGAYLVEYESAVA